MSEYLNIKALLKSDLVYASENLDSAFNFLSKSASQIFF